MYGINWRITVLILFVTPKGAVRPVDARIKSGEYIGFSKKHRSKKGKNEINER